MNKIALFLFLFLASFINAQERISNFEGGLIPQNATYIGQYNDHLYYYDTRQERTNVFKENLLDGTLESELIFSIDDRSSLDFERILLTESKLVFADNDYWYIYDVDNQEVLEFFYPEDLFLSDPIYAYGYGFMLYPDSIFQVDLNTGNTNTYARDLNSDSEFYFNDELNNVLIDSFAVVVDVDQNTDEQHFLSVNVFSGKTELIHTFDSSDFYFNPFFDKGRFHLQVVNTFDNTHKLYSFISKKGGVELNIEELEIPAEFGIEVVNENYCFAIEDEQVSGEFVRKLYLQDFQSDEYKELEYKSGFDFRELEITNDGVYFLKNNREFGLLNFAGDTTILLDNASAIFLAESEYDNVQGYINDDFIIANVRYDNNSIGSILFNKDGAVELGEPIVSDIIYDEKLDKTLVYYSIEPGASRIGSVENQEFKHLHMDELEIMAGGIFRAVDLSNNIISGEGQDDDFVLYRLNENYVEALFNEEDLGSTIFSINDELHFISRDGDENFLNKIILETNQIETTQVDLNGSEAIFPFEIYGGNDFAIIAFFSNGLIKLASLTSDGNFQELIDSDNQFGFEYSFFGNIEIINGNIYGLAENTATEMTDFVRFGRTYDETNILFSNVDPFTSNINNFVEGQNWSYINSATPFLIKNDGTLIEEDSSKPYYLNGKFYFIDKIFDEGQEQFSDWNSGLSEIDFVNNGFAYNNTFNSIEAVNIETLEKTVFELGGSSLVQYLEVEGKTAVVNHNSDKILVSDGTEEGSTIFDPNYSIPYVRTVGVLGSNLIYRTYDPSFGNELIAFNTVTGNEQIFDIYQGENSSNPDDFIQSTNDLYFFAFEPETGQQLYRLNDMVLSVVHIEEKSLELNVFPNPTSDFISIDEDISFEKMVIYSTNGSLVRITDRRKMINVSDLEQGTYFVKIIATDGVTRTGTFVKI